MSPASAIRLCGHEEVALEPLWLLNQSEVPHVGSVSTERMAWLVGNASFFRAAFVADTLAAFVVGFRPGTSYDSPNYRWFCERYDDFAYIDRVVVAPFARRRGLASSMYEAFRTSVPASASTLTCEVNLVPPNPTSMTFHERLGFAQVGTLTSDGGAKVVAMLATAGLRSALGGDGDATGERHRR